MLDRFSEQYRLFSAKESLGGASFFRTKNQDGKLIGSFLTELPDEFKTAVEKSSNFKLISIEKVTPEMFLNHEASKQESLYNSESSNSNRPAVVSVSPAELEFRLVAAEGDTNTPADELADPNDRTGRTKLRILKEVLLDSSAVASASLESGQSEDKAISVVLKSDATRKFSDITAANIGRRLAIVWRGRVLSAPVIRTKIPGPAISVTGKMSDAECQVLLDLLNFKSKPSATGPTTTSLPGTPDK